MQRWRRPSGRCSSDVGSVVVIDAGPVGIVTESDVFRALLVRDCSLSDLPARAVMSGPVTSIAPSVSVEHAGDVFREAGVKRLLVRNGLDVRGLVSVTDLAYHHRELYRDLVHTLDRGRNW